MPSRTGSGVSSTRVETPTSASARGCGFTPTFTVSHTSCHSWMSSAVWDRPRRTTGRNPAPPKRTHSSDPPCRNTPRHKGRLLPSFAKRLTVSRTRGAFKRRACVGTLRVQRTLREHRLRSGRIPRRFMMLNTFSTGCKRSFDELRSSPAQPCTGQGARSLTGEGCSVLDAICVRGSS
jgi:hypothetical protein